MFAFWGKLSVFCGVLVRGANTESRPIATFCNNTYINFGEMVDKTIKLCYNGSYEGLSIATKTVDKVENLHQKGANYELH